MNPTRPLLRRPDPSTLLVGGLWLSLLLSGCEQDVRQASFYQNVMGAYSDCDASEIRFLTAKQGVQPVFEPCGSNNILSASWSPDGIYVYFQLTHGGYLLDGENKTISTIETPLPVTGGIWLDEDRVAFILPPAEKGGSMRLGVHNRSANALYAVDVDLRDPEFLQPGDAASTLFVTDLDETDRRRPYRIDITTGKVEPAFSWLEGSIDSFTWEPDAERITWGVGMTSWMAAADGSNRVTFVDTLRAVVHPGGRYVALENLGEPVSPFDQQSWDEMSDEARERWQRRREAWVSRLPDWAPREVRPPSFDIYDTQSEQRYRFTSFQGDRFEWYPARDYYASFRLWGIEGKELNKNLALADLTGRLRLVDRGEFPRGIERVDQASPPASAQADEPAPEAEAVPTPQVDSRGGESPTDEPAKADPALSKKVEDPAVEAKGED